MQHLFRQFSTTGGVPSHGSVPTPGSIHEGGELGYVLAHAFRAAFDNPDLVVLAVVGDGEAETVPLEGAWKSCKFLNPVRDGAVLSILHLNGIFITFTGWFLLNAAQSAHGQSTLDTVFEGVLVSQVMTTSLVTTTANISLQKLVDEYFLPQGLRSAFVLQGDQLAGLITLSDVRHVPREQWGQTPVGLAMIPRTLLHTVTAQQRLKEVLPLMNGQDVNQLPVVQEGKLVGVLTREAILRSLDVRNTLGLTRKKAA